MRTRYLTEKQVAEIRGSIADMISFLVDVENNVPKEEEFFKRLISTEYSPDAISKRFAVEGFKDPVDKEP